jgi:hypothetical protein
VAENSKVCPHFFNINADSILTGSLKYLIELNAKNRKPLLVRRTSMIYSCMAWAYSDVTQQFRSKTTSFTWNQFNRAESCATASPNKKSSKWKTPVVMCLVRHCNFFMSIRVNLHQLLDIDRQDERTSLVGHILFVSTGDYQGIGSDYRVRHKRTEST